MSDGSRAHVLVVDDRVDMAEAIADVLSERGYTATALSSARFAIDRLRHDRVDAVVTELRLPDDGGLLVLDASRRLDPTRPVIIMTSDAAIDRALLASGHGAYQYLIKPFRIRVLERVLESALRDASRSGNGLTPRDGG